MEAYMEDKRNAHDPFNPAQVYPNRHRISPFSKKFPPKRSRTKNKKEERKQKGVRRIKRHYVPTFASAKAVMPTFPQLPAKAAMPTFPQPSAKAAIPAFPQLPAKTAASVTTTAVTSSPLYHKHKNYVIYVHLMDNYAPLLPQFLIGQMKIGTERKAEKEKGI